jgi:hypothetical protein
MSHLFVSSSFCIKIKYLFKSLIFVYGCILSKLQHLELNNKFVQFLWMKNYIIKI